MIDVYLSVKRGQLTMMIRINPLQPQLELGQSVDHLFLLGNLNASLFCSGQTSFIDTCL